MELEDKIRILEDRNFMLTELCKCQQNFIEQYKKFIEEQIIAKILEEDVKGDPWDTMQKYCFKRVTIPQTTFMLRCEPYLLHEWKWLQHETPLISLEYFINVAYKEQEEKKKC